MACRSDSWCNPSDVGGLYSVVRGAGLLLGEVDMVLVQSIFFDCAGTTLRLQKEQTMTGSSNGAGVALLGWLEFSASLVYIAAYATDADNGELPVRLGRLLTGPLVLALQQREMGLRAPMSMARSESQAHRVLGEPFAPFAPFGSLRFGCPTELTWMVLTSHGVMSRATDRTPRDGISRPGDPTTAEDFQRHHCNTTQKQRRQQASRARD